MTPLLFAQGSEIGILDKLVDKGPLGIVVAFAGGCGWMVWKLVRHFTEHTTKQQEACDARAAIRSAEFLAHNKQIADDHRANLTALVGAVKDDQVQTRAALDRLSNRLDSK